MPAIVDDSQALAPKQLALEIEAIQPFRAEESHQPLAVRDERRIRMRRLLVPLRSGLARADGPFPASLPGSLVKAQDHPLLLVVVLRGFDIAIIADSQGRFA